MFCVLSCSGIGTIEFIMRARATLALRSTPPLVLTLIVREAYFHFYFLISCRDEEFSHGAKVARCQ